MQETSEQNLLKPQNLKSQFSKSRGITIIHLYCQLKGKARSNTLAPDHQTFSQLLPQLLQTPITYVVEYYSDSKELIRV